MNDVLRANTHKGEILNLYNWPLLLTAIFLGMGLGIQAPINAWIGKRLGSPYWGASFSISISLVVILLFVVVMVRKVPSLETVWNAPWWIWFGGVFGAMFVAGAIVLGPKLGMALFFTCVVFGQVFISLLTDRFGWFEIPFRELSISRVLGVLLVIAGILLIQKEDFGLDVSSE